MEIIIALLIFGFLIFIHELGHYSMARVFHVEIQEFAIGMGPKLVSRISKKNGITYSLRLLPIGGYVSMEGEDEESTSEHALSNKPVWQRFFILVAGSVMNLLLGVILTCVLVGMSESLYNTTITEFVEKPYTAEAGLREGDTILAIGKQKVYTLYDMSYAIMHDATKPVTVTVLRDGERVVLRDVTFPTFQQSGMTFGMRDFYVEKEDKTAGTLIRHAFHQSVTSIRMIWESLFDLITGKYGIDQMSGPVGITTEIGHAASADDGGMSLLSLSALIALNLGVMNLLPLPALDGGRLFFLILEAIRRKPLKREVEGYIHFVGMALLLLLMVFITFMDISKLIG